MMSTQRVRRREGGYARTERESDGRRQRRERVRLAQLLVCLAVFLAVFLGRGVFPERLIQVRDSLLSLITADADFRAAFSDLGESMTEERSLLDRLGEFCVQVFGAAEPEEEPGGADAVPRLTSLLDQEQQFLSGAPAGAALAGHFFQGDGLSEPQDGEEEPPAEPAQPAPAPQEAETPEAVPAAGTVLSTPDYSGPALPEGYTLDCLSLGELETTTPVLGRLTSPYGSREHPVNGTYLFHGGGDISGNKGDPICCFADGVVEFVGENDSYGLYLQVDHGNSVKSFYAHCSAVYVKKGQQVSLGERIAAVGDTGLATASHLHLELRCAGWRMDPTYYIDFLSDQ